MGTFTSFEFRLFRASSDPHDTLVVGVTEASSPLAGASQATCPSITKYACRGTGQTLRYGWEGWALSLHLSLGHFGRAPILTILSSSALPTLPLHFLSLVNHTAVGVAVVNVDVNVKVKVNVIVNVFVNVNVDVDVNVDVNVYINDTVELSSSVELSDIFDNVTRMFVLGLL